MILEFLPEATEELYAAAEYYESKQKGLGWRFRSEVLELCQLIMHQPVLWRERRGGYRRVNCPVFPYYVAYFIRGDRVVVAAVARGHQRPEYWKDRLQSKGYRPGRTWEEALRNTRGAVGSYLEPAPEQLSLSEHAEVVEFVGQLPLLSERGQLPFQSGSH